MTIIAFEALMLCLAVWSGVRYYRGSQRKAVILLTTDRRSLTYVLMRDSILIPFMYVFDLLHVQTQLTLANPLPVPWRCASSLQSVLTVSRST